MTLKEKISLPDKETAQLFQVFLRKNNCSSHLSTETKYIIEKVYAGTLADFKSLANTIKVRNLNFNETSLINDETETDELTDDIDSLQNLLNSYESSLIQFFSQYKVGDTISKNEIYRELMELEKVLEPDDEDDTKTDSDNSDEIKSKYLSLRKEMKIVDILESNKIIESELTDKAKLTVIKTEDPYNIIIPIDPDEFYFILPNDLKSHEIREFEKNIIKTNYVVTTDIIFPFINIDELTDFLDNIMIDDDVRIKIFRNYYLKNNIIDIIGNIIKSNNSIYQVDLYQKLTEMTFHFSDDDDYQSNIIDIDIECFNTILSEMKKIGLISIKNNVIKNAEGV